MPKVMLTQDAKDREATLKQNKVLIDQMKSCDKTIVEIAKTTEISKEMLHLCKRDPARISQMSLERVRRVAHQIGMTKSQWDALGGFK